MVGEIIAVVQTDPHIDRPQPWGGRLIATAPAEDFFNDRRTFDFSCPAGAVIPAMARLFPKQRPEKKRGRYANDQIYDDILLSGCHGEGGDQYPSHLPP